MRERLQTLPVEVFLGGFFHPGREVRILRFATRRERRELIAEPGFDDESPDTQDRVHETLRLMEAQKIPGGRYYPPR